VHTLEAFMDPYGRLLVHATYMALDTGEVAGAIVWNNMTGVMVRDQPSDCFAIYNSTKVRHHSSVSIN
jgi:hypothetical protein